MIGVSSRPGEPAQQLDPQTATFGAFDEWAGGALDRSVDYPALRTRQFGSCLGSAADEVDLMPGSLPLPTQRGRPWRCARCGNAALHALAMGVSLGCCWRREGPLRGANVVADAVPILMQADARCSPHLMLDGTSSTRDARRSTLCRPTAQPSATLASRRAPVHSSRRAVRHGRLQRLTAGYREETSGVAGESPVRFLSRPLDGEATKAGRWGWASTTLACMSTRDTAKSRSFPSLEFRMSSLFLMTAYAASAS
jgi:hypothetical protein